jgi:hypothetical protein
MNPTRGRAWVRQGSEGKICSSWAQDRNELHGHAATTMLT